MKFVSPAIFLVAKSVPQDDAIRDWLLHIGCDNDVAERFATGGNKTNGERIIELAGRRCYLAFQPEKLNPNVTKIREDIAVYCENILKQKHGSVLTHVWFSFGMEGISRVMTAELNRHGVGSAISEGSMRYIAFNNIPFVETPAMKLTDEDLNDPDYVWYMKHATSDDNLAGHTDSIAVKKQLTRELFEWKMRMDEDFYVRFRSIWWKELQPSSTFRDKKHLTSLGRRGISMGVATGGMWSYNIRSLRHLITMRSAESAEEEIAVVAVMMLQKMMLEEPVLFGDFHQNEKGFWEPIYEKV